MTQQASYPDLEARTVLVTGAAHGLGEAIARAFLAQGSHVVALARGPVAWAAPQSSKRLEVLACDIRDLSPVRAWLAALDASGGRLDALVNNAGVLIGGRLLDVSSEDLDCVFEVNLRATFLLSQLVAGHMRGRGGGVMVQLASYAVTLSSVGTGVYAASKAALASLSRSMAAEWAPYGIRVNACSPGVVSTRMTAPAIDSNRSAMHDAIALHRFGTAEEIAAVVVFLCSSASSYITGTNVDASGGKLIVQNPAAAWA